MEILLADVAPQPSVPGSSALVVIGLACVVFVAALVVLLVWFLRRRSGR
ncbi:hypothetical protein ABT369_19885 [Dactylosporangium sp. NPDC000244]